jgi:hypothetical protein
MKRAEWLFGLTIVACGLWSSAARADVLAEYTYENGANFNPQTQGWTLGNDTGEGVNFFDTGTNLLIQEASGGPHVLFSNTVSTNAFSHAWSMKGNNRFAGNSQEEFGMFMFADDGTNLWHMSFYNHGNDDFDGIYMGGDPNGPVLSNTATKVWAEDVATKPFDGFHDWALVDADGAGGAAPIVQLDGVALNPVVTAIPAPSMFPAGTVGWGTLNPFEQGFFQTTHMVFEGSTAPPPGLAGDYNNNHVVDGADYVVWRENAGTTNVLPNDPLGGTIGSAQYNQWRAHFGMTLAAAASAALPEPQSLALLVIAVAAPQLRRRARR